MFTRILCEQGVPLFPGAVGTYYLDVLTLNLYRQDAAPPAIAWTFVANLAGGPPGPAGPTYVFTYAPGHPSPPAGTYTSWPALMAARALVGAARIQCSEEYGALSIPAGVWDMRNTVLSGPIGTFGQVNLTCLAGAVLQDLNQIENISLLSASPTPVLTYVTFVGGLFPLILRDNAFLGRTFGGSEVFSVGAADFMFMLFDGGGIFNSAFGPVINVDGFLQGLTVAAGGLIYINTVGGAGFAQIDIQDLGSVANIVTTQPIAFFSVSNQNNATALSYFPNALHWAPPAPTDAKAAIDRLAKVWFNNFGPVPL